MPRLLVSLGSNVGDASAAIDAAEAGLREIAEGAVRVSDRVESAPIGGPRGQDAYTNAVACFECVLDPLAVLARVQAIESSFGRQRAERWDARTLDIDLLLYDERVYRSAELCVPHPRMTFRPFVMTPAAEVAADWRHPVCGELSLIHI